MSQSPSNFPQKEDSPFTYNPLVMLQQFLKTEASGGIILLICAVAAMIIANTDLYGLYHHILHETKAIVAIGPLAIEKDIIHWINDGLMAIFFFLVGLEIKREVMEGMLSKPEQLMLPIVAAVGGMAIPGLIFYFTNQGTPEALAGWATPTATDIAFALGILSVLGKRIPLALKVFLLALAIIDDLGAIIIIALFYTHHLELYNLLIGLAFIAGLIGLNALNVTKGSFYLLLGIGLWICVLKSGVHATLAGVLAAFAIPLNIKGERRSLLRQMEHDLHALVAYFVMPVFAFANAGVSLAGATWGLLLEPVTFGVIAGLFIGKQVGIVSFTWLFCKLGITKLPQGISYIHVWGVSILAGIGFTMSLFIATLGYQGNPLFLTEAKVGILAGSTISAITGIIVLYLLTSPPAEAAKAPAKKLATPPKKAPAKKKVAAKKTATPKTQGSKKKAPAKRKPRTA